MPHFQVVLGGQWKQNAGSYGLAIGAVPARLVPDVIDAITRRYVADRAPEESFQDWATRLGKQEARELIRPFMVLPAYEEQPAFFSDWGDPRVFTLGDLGVGECAGEVVSLFSMEITRAESEAFEAQLALEARDYARADALAYQAMVLAARALVRTRFLDVGDDPDRIVGEFRTRFYDTRLFYDQYAKGKFAQYLLDRHENPVSAPNADTAHQLIEEALLFIEAAHACDMRLNSTPEEEAAPRPKPAGLPPSVVLGKRPPVSSPS
jgi:sulfite reductase (ferredoxin)